MYADRIRSGRFWRRFLSRGLPVAAAVSAMLWAVQAGAFEPPTKADPKTEAKDDEPRYEFAMHGKPWKDVFAWVNEKTNLPVVGFAIPTGSITIFGKPDKKYTMGEVIDLINAGLLANEDTNKYFLIRREREFVLVPADQKDKIGPLAPMVEVKDLPKFGKSQFVTVVVPLKKLVAEEVKDDFAKSLSVFGNVVAMKPNSLKITDQVGAIEFILKMIVINEDDEGKNIESYAHVCKWVVASEAARRLEKLLPDPEKMLKYMGAAPPAQPTGDPRFQPRQPTVALVKPKFFAVDADDTRNVVIVTGPADILAKAKDLVEKQIDMKIPGQSPVLPGPPTWKNYPIGGGNADALATDMKKIFTESATLRITAAGNNSIRVFATPEYHEIIRSQIYPDGKGGTIDTEKINTGSQDPTTLAALLVEWLGPAKTGAPNVTAIPEDNSIGVRGTREQIDEVKAIVKTLSGFGGASGTDNTRILTLEKGSAVSVTEEMARMLRSLRPNNPVETPRAGGDTIPELRPRPVEETKPPKPMDKAPEQSRLPKELEGMHYISHQPDVFVDPQKKPVPAEGKPITIAASGNKIIIYSEDPQALAYAMAVYKLITKTGTTAGDFEVIRLKYANAVDAANVLDEVFNGKRQQQPGGRGNRGGGFGAQFGQQPAPAAPTTDPNAVRVVADPNTNSLVVRATVVDMLTIRRLLREQIDNPDVNTTALMKPYTIGPLKNTNATEVMTWLNALYHEQTGSTARATQVSGMPGFGFGNFGGEDAADSRIPPRVRRPSRCKSAWTTEPTRSSCCATRRCTRTSKPWL